MKKYQVLKRVLFLTLTLLSFKTHFAQPNTVSISTTVESDHPSWNSGNAIPLCSGNSVITVLITNNSGQTINGFVIQELPEQIIPVPSLATVQAGCDIGLDDHPSGLSFHIENFPANSTCEVVIPFYIECASVMQNTILSIQYSAINPLIVNAPIHQFQISKPQMLLTNFVRHDGTIMLDETAIQQLPISNESNRGFEIRVSNGLIEAFQFDYTLETELEFIRFEVESFYGNGNPTGLSTTIYDNFQNSENLINSLFPAGYMTTGNFLKVTEYFIVNNCSPTINDATIFNLSWPCHNNTECDNFPAERYVLVKAATTGVSRHLGIDPQLDICGQTPSTITFTFTNPTPNTNQGYLTSGGKKIETVVFPFDLDWITYGSIWLVDASCPACETEITSVPYFVIDNVAKRCTLNVSDIPAGIQIPPFQDLYLTDNFFHELAEGSGFRIQFRNAAFQCNAGEFYNNAGAFTSCRTNAGGFMMFGPNPNTHFRIDYQNMCNMLSNTTQTANHEYANYYNSFPMTMLAEANPTDVVEYDNPNATVDFFYAYSGTSSNPSPFLFNAAISPQFPFFNCNTITYHAVLTIPEVFDLNLSTTGTQYYANPNDLNSYVNVVPFFVGTSSEGGVNYNLYRINDIGYNGLVRISLSVNNENCQTGTGGLAELSLELRSVCNECDTCAYTVRCVKTSIYYHCDGPCSAPVGTDEYSFNFNRTTLGWTDNTLSTVVTPNPSLSYNRTYSCDRIEVSAEGVISSTANIDDAFFLIDYYSDVNFQFYEYVDGSGTFSFIAADSTPIADDLISMSDLTGFAGNCSVCSLRVYIDPLKVQELISHGGGAVSFSVVFKVKEMDGGTPADGFYSMPQVRGQFVGELGSNLYYSCDSWGDNMTVIKVRTVRNPVQEGVYCDGYANESRSMYDQGLCNRWFYISTRVIGGMIGLNEFPEEFRPITLWPETGSNDFIELEIPPGFSFSGNASFANAVNSWVGVDTELIGGNTIRFKGLSGMNDWPIVEHDGSAIAHRLKGVLNNDCPPTETPAPATLTFPYTKRGFAVDDVPCQQEVVEVNVYDNISVSTYVLELTTTAASGITLTSIDGSIGGFQLRYWDQTGCAGESASPLQNAWILNQSNGIVINSIIKDGGAPILPNAFGYFELGNMNHMQIYNIVVNYEIVDCDNPDINLQYGFACQGYTDIANYDCSVNSLLVPVTIAESEFEMVVQEPTSTTGSPCDDYTYIVTLNSTSEADVENIELILNMHSSFTVVSATYSMTLGGSQSNLPFATNCIGQNCEYVFDVNAAAYGNNGLPPASSSNSIVYLFITVHGDCDLHGTIQELIYSVSATDICGVSIAPDNNNVEMLLDFPISIPLGNNCLNECPECSAEFQITQLSNCCLHFEDLTPDTLSCTNDGWQIFLNSTLVANYPENSSFEHCFEASGVYTICNTVCCTDGTTEVLCSQIEVQCDSIKPIDDFCFFIRKDGNLDEVTSLTKKDDSSFALVGTMHREQNNPDKYLTLISADQIASEWQNPGSATPYPAARIGEANGSTITRADKGRSVLVKGNYIFSLGETTNINSGDVNLVVTCFNWVEEEIEWSHEYNSSGVDIGVKILDMGPDYDKIIIIGNTKGETTLGSWDIFALKLGIDGSIISSNILFPNAELNQAEFAMDAVKLDGLNEYAIVGNYYKNDDTDMLAFKIDYDLQIISTISFIGSDYEEKANGIVQVGSRLYVVGSIDQYNENSQVYVVELNASNMQPTSTNAIYLSTNTNLKGNKIILDEDGDLIVAGYAQFDESAESRGLVLKMAYSPNNSKHLDLMWASITNMDESAYFNDLTLHTTNFAMVGGAYEIDSGDTDMLLVQVDTKTGEACCLKPVNLVKKAHIKSSIKDIGKKEINWSHKKYGKMDKDFLAKFICVDIEGPEMEVPLKSADRKMNFSVFPNPNRGSFTVSLSEASDQLRSIIIFDVSGRIVEQVKFDGNGDGLVIYDLDAKHLQSGVYLLKVESVMGTKTTRVSVIH